SFKEEYSERTNACTRSKPKMTRTVPTCERTLGYRHASMPAVNASDYRGHYALSCCESRSAAFRNAVELPSFVLSDSVLSAAARRLYLSRRNNPCWYR